MANLLGQNIGTNYKGILNLNTLNGNLSGTLESVTDGDGNASPLRLSTTQASVNGQLSVLKDSGTLAYIGNTAGNSGFNFLFNQISAIGGNAFYISNTGSNIIFEVSSVERGRFTGANFVLGHTSASARLHVRGDGTNPILRTEDNSGNAVGFVVNNNSVDIYGRNFSTNGYLVNIFNGLSYGPTSGTVGYLNFNNTSFGANAGSANFRPLNIAYTINNSGAQTGTATGIFLNATETALNGMTHNLMDLQRGGVSQFRVDRLGDVRGNSFTGSGYFSIVSEQRINFGIAPNRTIFAPIGDGVFRITNGAETDFGRLQFGGITNAFPALKRNGAALEVRLADDSGFADLSAKILNLSSTAFIGGNSNVSGASGAIAGLIAGAGFSSRNASAILQADSTTMGFLPPRMTTAQRDAIATPATGLMIYNTSTNRPNFYDGSAWVAL